MKKIDMPIMRPVPVNTKNQSTFTQLKRWITIVRQWEIMENWQFTLPSGVKITIPAGFVFDGASVPRVFWCALSPTGILFIPSLIHDFGYHNGFFWATSEDGHRYQYGELFNRETFDQIFYDVCKKVNGIKYVSRAAWLMI